MILAIDCSDRACSVALGEGGKVKERFTDEARQHALQLKPMYRQLLSGSDARQTDITAVAVGAGPGSFTGLRIGFSFAQGLSFALKVPLYAISSLEAMAQTELGSIQGSIQSCEQIEVAFDARMGEIYCASFTLSQGQLVRKKPDQLVAEAEYSPESGPQFAMIGSAFALPTFSGLDAGYCNSEACIRASSVLSLAEKQLAAGSTGLPAVGAEPAYLRRENAWKTLDQQRKKS
jgi:tRNA threonylcarbamoyladenosine biosynthesis protein TsaB